ncbi:hypothetical protein GGD83_000854 [Rhodoblastus sphagnicola]|nr:toll/interleukin-1 receptor domain-containing protein [Rhodoblastus sphagnicola]MBB4197077.1 hypothetical protein [Rhodoblastus sphagnicola]
MRKLWISYSWKDNSENDVDFIAQRIGQAGVLVKLDRLVLEAGQRLWPQIERHICDPKECDAWCIYLTQNSLTSEAVLEEISYAVDRALRSRGNAFPIVAINPGDVDKNSVPASLRTRLYIDLTDPNWIERIVAATQGRPPNISIEQILPFFLKEHNLDGKRVVEIHPRAGRWHPAFVATLASEAKYIGCLMQGPSGRASLDGMINSGTFSYDNLNEKISGTVIFHNITPINSIYVELSGAVSKLIFGSIKGEQLDEAYQYNPPLT